MYYKRTVDVGKDLERLEAYMAYPPKKGSIIRLKVKSPWGSSSTMADFLVTGIVKSKTKRAGKLKKYLVVLQKV